MNNTELNCLSYWFPKIRDACLPVPKTEILRITDAERTALWPALDGEPFGVEATPFFEHLRLRAKQVGVPCFLRTGQTSGKHCWRNTCFVESLDKIEGHAVALIDFSECAGIFGLPWDVWCVREMLPTKPALTLEAYDGMPLCREYRCFVADGRVICSHPYWPKQSILEGIVIPDNMAGKPLRHLFYATDKAYKQLAEPAPEEVLVLASKAGVAVGGDWSVDVLETEAGWYVTDMATAGDSFHWEGCEHASQFAAA